MMERAGRNRSSSVANLPSEKLVENKGPAAPLQPGRLHADLARYPRPVATDKKLRGRAAETRPSESLDSITEWRLKALHDNKRANKSFEKKAGLSVEKLRATMRAANDSEAQLTSKQRTAVRKAPKRLQKSADAFDALIESGKLGEDMNAVCAGLKHACLNLVNPQATPDPRWRLDANFDDAGSPREALAPDKHEKTLPVEEPFNSPAQKPRRANVEGRPDPFGEDRQSGAKLRERLKCYDHKGRLDSRTEDQLDALMADNGARIVFEGNAKLSVDDLRGCMRAANHPWLETGVLNRRLLIEELVSDLTSAANALNRLRGNGGLGEESRDVCIHLASKCELLIEYLQTHPGILPLGGCFVPPLAAYRGDSQQRESGASDHATDRLRSALPGEREGRGIRVLPRQEIGATPGALRLRGDPGADLAQPPRGVMGGEKEIQQMLDATGRDGGSPPQTGVRPSDIRRREAEKRQAAEPRTSPSLPPSARPHQ